MRPGLSSWRGRLALGRAGAIWVTVLCATLTLPVPATLQTLSGVQRPAPLRSGFDTMSAPIQAMQREDAANPGMLWVAQGEAQWLRPSGASGRACADCHGPLKASMTGVAVRYPRWDDAMGRAIDLSGRVEYCRTRHQQAAPLGPEDSHRLSLTTAIAHASRGQVLRPDSDPRLSAAREQGRAHFLRRMGQLDLSCADCHDRHWGQRLAGSLIPQGHGNGYPLYRLEWQALGSLQRRLRNCLTGVRAQPWPADAPQYIELELYLQTRADGLRIEAPAVRP